MYSVINVKFKISELEFQLMRVITELKLCSNEYRF